MAEWPAELEPSLGAYLGAQRWYAGAEPPRPEQVGVEETRELWSDRDGRALWQLLVTVGEAAYQLVLGVRPSGEAADFLRGHEAGLLGSTAGAFVYDAAFDGEMARRLLEVISSGAQRAERARPMVAEQSNTSIVYDDRIVLKLFRRLRPGRNPDVEVTTALAQSGFEHVARPLVTWRDDRYDLAFGQEFLAGGSEGWALALTSLRSLFTSRETDIPAESGGDFAAEAARLGAVTADMHVAMRAVFGAAPAGRARQGWSTLVEGLPARLRRASEGVDRDLLAPAQPMLARLQEVGDPGPAFRVHGDFHLGQVMRTDKGWYILDFEGEPERSVDERVAPASPLKDVAGMLRSFHYASRHALVERAAAEWEVVEPDSRAWETHNRQAFLDGYQGRPGISSLLPDPAVAPAVMIGYEIDKALYELEYELSHRPEWVSIPLEALGRLVQGGTGA